MISIQESLAQLEARLPELSWRLENLQCMPLPHQLPQGLFRQERALTPKTLMEEVKLDLDRLKQQADVLSAQHIAQKINHKITVLVHWCQHHTSTPSTTGRMNRWNGLEALSTRQQLFDQLCQEIDTLKLQQQAVEKTLSEASKRLSHTPKTTQKLLQLQHERGIIMRRLGESQELMKRLFGSQRLD